jgi:hypothetical protein
MANVKIRASRKKKTAVGGLAGAAAIAVATSGYADVMQIAPPSNLLPAQPGGFPTPAGGISTVWDLNGDGTNDFSFDFVQNSPFGMPSNTGTPDWQANMQPLTGSASGVVGFFNLGNSLNYASRLTPGQTVSSANTFIHPPNQAILGSRYGTNEYGEFLPPNSSGFVGFSITLNGNQYFGWLQLKAGRDYGISFTNAAWETSPNTGITVGAVPEPQTWVSLAIGAAALLAPKLWRRRRRLG